jgi:hypothetical protein
MAKSKSGPFGFCWGDARCQAAWKNAEVLRAHEDTLQAALDAKRHHAQRHLSIWSTYAIKEAEDIFWARILVSSSWAVADSYLSSIDPHEAARRKQRAKESNTSDDTEQLSDIIATFLAHWTLATVFFAFDLIAMLTRYKSNFFSGAAFFIAEIIFCIPCGPLIAMMAGYVIAAGSVIMGPYYLLVAMTAGSGTTKDL